jgi:hypothetical protein
MAPGPNVEVSADARDIGNHDAGSGRPVTNQEAAMHNDNRTHALYAGVNRHTRSLVTCTQRCSAYSHLLSALGSAESYDKRSARLAKVRRLDLVRLFGAASMRSATPRSEPSRCCERQSRVLAEGLNTNNANLR